MGNCVCTVGHQTGFVRLVSESSPLKLLCSVPECAPVYLTVVGDSVPVMLASVPPHVFGQGEAPSAHFALVWLLLGVSQLVLHQVGFPGRLKGARLYFAPHQLTGVVALVEPEGRRLFGGEPTLLAQKLLLARMNHDVGLQGVFPLEASVAHLQQKMVDFTKK